MPACVEHPELVNSAEHVRRRVIVCAGTGCAAGGSWKVLEAFRALDADATYSHDACPHREITKSGCQGFCQMGPLVSILPENIFYTKVQPADVPEIVERTLGAGETVDRLLYQDPATRKKCRGTDEIPFYKRQTRFVLKDCGYLDPENIDEYLANGGYEAAKLAWTKMKPEEICNEILKSGLRGRGGGGFPTGRKWEAARAQNNPKKYVICNGDEGDPGAFMDRSVMEGNPHSVIEGLMIAARAIGADHAYVYVRAEYPLAVKRMRRAVADAEAHGILGENVFGSGLKVRCEVMEGAGAFVCGEETVMIASIDGMRGMPSPKPPFPAQSGLRGKPTIINNVETLAQVPRILLEGADAYRALGTPTSPGTKTFALTGHVVNTGLIEVPFGTTLREMFPGPERSWELKIFWKPSPMSLTASVTATMPRWKAERPSCAWLSTLPIPRKASNMGSPRRPGER
jgi:NADH-quinone oxidoreductase subunit F